MKEMDFFRHKHKWRPKWTTTGHNVWTCSKCGQESFHESIDNPNKPRMTFEELKEEWERETYGKAGHTGFNQLEVKGAEYFAEWLDKPYKD